MKLTHILAAGLLMAGVGVSTEASAQRHDGYSQHDRDGRWDRNDRDHRWSRHDNGRHNGWRNHHRQNCRIVWRHHHRVRVCR